MTKNLLLVQWPPIPNNPAYFFEEFGYAVTCIDVIYLQDIIHIDSSVKAKGFSLEDFDVIVLTIAGGASKNNDYFTFTEESIKLLKDKIANIGLAFEKQITLVGANWGLPHDLETEQVKIFNGLFIGKETPQDKIPFILQGYPNKKT